MELYNKRIDFDEQVWKAVIDRVNNSKIKDLNQLSMEYMTNMYSNIDDNVKFKYHATFWGLFAVVADGLSLITTLLVVFGTLTYTRLFGLLGVGIVIIQPTPINGWNVDLIPDINILPKIEFQVLEDVTAISWIIKVILTLSFIIMLVLFVTTKWFRTVRLSVHYGKYIPSNIVKKYFQFAIEINIYNKTQFFRYVVVENINIKIPLTTIETKKVFDIKCKNSIVTWSIDLVNGKPTIIIADKIHLIAIS